MCTYYKLISSNKVQKYKTFQESYVLNTYLLSAEFLTLVFYESTSYQGS